QKPACPGQSGAGHCGFPPCLVLSTSTHPDPDFCLWLDGFSRIFCGRMFLLPPNLPFSSFTLVWRSSKTLASLLPV
ncbi:hypothetical protein LEMLEM_LOCUS16785, partial [Lemmus lemmus]